MKEIDIKKRLAENWFSYLQLEICNQFQKLENTSKGIKKSKFVKRKWRKKGQQRRRRYIISFIRWIYF